jgi:hypothetical protein
VKMQHIARTTQFPVTETWQRFAGRQPE